MPLLLTSAVPTVATWAYAHTQPLIGGIVYGTLDAAPVGAVSGLPLGGGRFNLSFEVKGRPPVPPAQQPTLEVRVVTPEPT